MNLKEILAIAGYPGLYKYVSQAKNGIIVESLLDKKRMPAYSSAKVSALEDIAIFTENAEVPLGDIFSKIYEKESGGVAPDAKSSTGVLTAYFEGILPDYDKKKVYVSDIKKVITWYNILHGLNLLNLPDEAKSETGEIAIEHPKPLEPKVKLKTKTLKTGNFKPAQEKNDRKKGIRKAI
jgi:hypothetical protein